MIRAKGLGFVCGLEFRFYMCFIEFSVSGDIEHSGSSANEVLASRIFGRFYNGEATCVRFKVGFCII